jgi:membrane fusion protein (multidrug efflux system)
VPRTGEDIVKAQISTLSLLALLLGGAFQLGCTVHAKDGKSLEEEGAEDETEDEAVPVELTDLETGRIEAVLKFSSNLEAENAVEVLAEAAGRVLSVLVEEGDEVAAGETLIRLEDSDQRSALGRAEAELAKALREYERQETLHRKGLVSDQVFNESTWERDRLQLAVADASRAIAKTQVRAPIAGTVTKRLVQQGGHVASGEHLFDLADFDSLVARVYVPEKELGRLAIGQDTRVLASAAGDDAHPGRVDRIAPMVDASSGTVKVTVAVARQDGLLPGMFVELELVTAVHPEAIRIPKRALVWEQERPQVFRLAEDGRVDRIAIETALEDRWFLEPVTGFAVGDRIVVAGQAGLKDRALVRVVGDEPAGGEEPTESEAAPQS